MSTADKLVICMPFITRYFEGAIRPFIEGKAILNTNKYLSNVRKISESGINGNNVEIFTATCIQSSYVFAAPHNLVIKFHTESGDLIGSCSCTGGANGKCKHICALLMFLERVDKVESVSCTDIKCSWNQGPVRDLYTPIPISQYCHVNVENSKKTARRKRSIGIMPEDGNECKKAALVKAHERLNAAFPQSAYIRQKIGRGTEVDLSSKYVLLSQEDLVFLLQKNEEESLLNDTEIPTFTEEQAELENFFQCCVNITVSEAIEIQKNTCHQRNDPLWKDERKVRITGSIAHELFTYKKTNKEDWTQKVHRIFFKTFNPTNDMIFGILNESTAISIYRDGLSESENCKIVTHAGLLINVKYPWLAFSPDGFIKNANGELTLLEVKCEKKGRSLTPRRLVRKLPYLIYVKKKGLEIKRRHRYNSQIQLGLGLFGIKKAVLIIYCEKMKSIVTIDVPYDHEYFMDLFLKLTKVYFKYILPEIYNRIMPSSDE